MVQKIDYTVIYLNYNQGIKLQDSINDWLKLPSFLLPTEVIIVDDGSDPVPKSSGIVRVIPLSHTMHMAHLANVGVDVCKTDWFIYWDAGRQLTLDYIGGQIQLANKEELNIPFEINVKERNSFISKFIPIGYRVELHDSEFLPTGLPLMNKETFLYYNEIYDKGLGRHDMDYNYRWLLSGRKIFFCSTLMLIHIDHPRSYQKQELIIRNEFVYKQLLPEYKKMQTTSLKNYPNYTYALTEAQEKYWNEEALPKIKSTATTSPPALHT